MTAAVIDEAAIAASVWQKAAAGLGAPAPTKMPTLCSGAELLRADLPEPRALIHPLIAEGDQMMLYGYRGSGKTWLALALACALASGGRFLVWKAMRPARVMIADGEMRASRMKKRLQLVIAGIDRDIADDDLQILTRDMQPRDAHWPDLGTVDGRAAMLQLAIASKCEVLIIDNISAWCRTGEEENNEKSARGINQFVLDLRAAGIAGVLVHHSGKNGQQRGTSRREDVLDTVIALRKPEDAGDGLDTELHFEKARNIEGAEQTPLRIRLVTDGGAARFDADTLQRDPVEHLRELAIKGLTRAEAIAQMGIDRNRLNRIVGNAKNRGIVIPFPDARSGRKGGDE